MRRNSLLLAMVIGLCGSCGRPLHPPSHPDSGTGTPPDGAADGGGGMGDVAPDAAEPANLTLSVATVDLGSVVLGKTTPPQTVAVTNTGGTISGTLAVTVDGAGITATGCAGTLAPGANCTITVTGTPTAYGPIAGSVSVAEGSSTPKVITVSGRAIGECLSGLLPAFALDFGKISVGETATRTIILTGAPTTSLTGIVVTINGQGFTRSPTSTCTDSLPLCATCEIGVDFTGTTPGVATGTVIVSQGGVTDLVALTATAVPAAKLVVSPTTAVLSATVGVPSSPVTFYVDNAGYVPSGIPIVTLTGPNAADFSIVSNSCVAGLAALSTCQVSVVFTPSGSLSGDVEAAILTVTDSDPPGSSAQATLFVTGEGGGLTLSGGPDLGLVAVGETGAAVSFTLKNHGGNNSGTITVATSDSTEFLSSADLCTGRDLAPNGSCSFLLQFKPPVGAAGVVTARVTASAASFANPAVLTVTGTAVPPGTGGSGGGGSSGGSSGGGSGGGTGGRSGESGDDGGGDSSGESSDGGGSNDGAGGGGSSGGNSGESSDGGGSNDGAGGQGGTSGASTFTPMCSTLTTLTGVAPTKNGVCTGADPQLCYKTCGPESLGFKSEICTGGSYVEQSGCSFPAGVDYSCFKIPIRTDPRCPTIMPQANMPCAVAACVLCNVSGGYFDSTGAAKSGYCVCPWSLGPGQWSCATMTAWPCPAGQGC